MWKLLEKINKNKKLSKLFWVIVTAGLIIGLRVDHLTLLPFEISFWTWVMIFIAIGVADSFIEYRKNSIGEIFVRGVLLAFALYLICQVLLSSVFTLNRCVGGGEKHQEKVVIEYHGMQRYRRGIPRFVLCFHTSVSPEKVWYYFDRSYEEYFSGVDMCVVTYHKGCLGLYAIDNVDK